MKKLTRVFIDDRREACTEMGQHREDDTGLDLFLSRDNDSGRLPSALYPNSWYFSNSL